MQPEKPEPFMDLSSGESVLRQRLHRLRAALFHQNRVVAPQQTLIVLPALKEELENLYALVADAIKTAVKEKHREKRDVFIELRTQINDVQQAVINAAEMADVLARSHKAETHPATLAEIVEERGIAGPWEAHLLSSLEKLLDDLSYLIDAPGSAPVGLVTPRTAQVHARLRPDQRGRGETISDEAVRRVPSAQECGR